MSLTLLIFAFALSFASGASSQEYYDEPSQKKDYTDRRYEKSKLVVIAEYKTFFASRNVQPHEAQGTVTWNHPPIAVYTVVETIKTDLRYPMRTLHVIYDFYNPKSNTSCPKGWKFKGEKTMPKPGSKWILFIKRPDRECETFNGPEGRVLASDAEIERLNSVVEQHNEQYTKHPARDLFDTPK